MGLIYQGEDTHLGDIVVIKQARHGSLHSLRQDRTYRDLTGKELRDVLELMQQSIEREAELLYRLRHPALPLMFDDFNITTEDGSAEHKCLVMEFIEGEDLNELLSERLRTNQGPFPLDQVLDWADQILDALNYLHEASKKPILHRDINPRNLKRKPNGQIALLDFGLAKGARPGMSVAESILGGTGEYAPIEQLDGDENARQQSDSRSDLYSLSMTLHHLLSGRLPGKTVSRVSAMAQGRPDPLRPIHELVPAVPESVADVLHRAAAVFAKDRLASAAEMRQLLRQAPAPAPPFETTSLPDPVPDPVTEVVLWPRRSIRLYSAARTEGARLTITNRPAQPQSFREDLGNGVKLEMIRIPGGAFSMGSLSGVGCDREHPLHRVKLQPFCVGKYPVTQAQWVAVMGNNPSDFIGDTLPVERVSWRDAREFCEAISKRTNRIYRLPTEAEWEYACRAESTGPYCFGDDKSLLDQFAWYGNNSGRRWLDTDKLDEEVSQEWDEYWPLVVRNGCRTHPVGLKMPNSWGVHDMHGNVWELCQDWYDDCYYAHSPVMNPQGPDSGEWRVVRGGSWGSLGDLCRSAHRDACEMDRADNHTGFRVVCAAEIL